MKRAHNQMKRAHEDDRGTNLVYTYDSIPLLLNGNFAATTEKTCNSFGEPNLRFHGKSSLPPATAASEN